MDTEANTLQELGLNGDEANCKNFDLPTVKDKLERAAVNVHEGCGVSIITGSDWSGLSPEDKLTLFLAISDYVGDVRGVQNRKGDMISTLAPSFFGRRSKSNILSICLSLNQDHQRISQMLVNGRHHTPCVTASIQTETWSVNLSVNW